MTRSTRIAILVAWFALISSDTWAQEPTAQKYFASEFRTGPSWDHSKRPQEQRHFAEHSKNLQRLREEGRLTLGARYGDKELIIVTAASLEEAAGLFASDPTVKDSVFVHDIAQLAAFYPGTVGQAPPPKVDPAPPPPSVELPQELARALIDYEMAWKAKDAAALAALFTEDGFVLPGGRPPVHGREAIRKYYTGLGGPVSLRAFAWQASETSRYILGAYTSKPGAPDLGKFTLTLTRIPGGPWMIVSDMDSGNTRPWDGCSRSR